MPNLAICPIPGRWPPRNPDLVQLCSFPTRYGVKAALALVPRLTGLDSYGANDVTGWHDRKNLVAHLDRFYARPAVARRKNIPPRD